MKDGNRHAILTKYERKGKKPRWKLEVDGYFVTLTTTQLRDHPTFNRVARRQTLTDEHASRHARAFTPLMKRTPTDQWHRFVDGLARKARKVQE